MKRKKTSEMYGLILGTKILSLQMFFSLSLTGMVSIFGGILTYSIIPKFRDMFIKVEEQFNISFVLVILRVLHFIALTSISRLGFLELT